MKPITPKQKWEKKFPEKARQSALKARKKNYSLYQKERLLFQREDKIKRKHRVLSFYSHLKIKPVCRVCKYDSLVSLDLDHIEEGTKPSLHSQRLYRWIEKNNYPKGFQVLCRNHNYEKFYNYLQTKVIK